MALIKSCLSSSFDFSTLATVDSIRGAGVVSTTGSHTASVTSNGTTTSAHASLDTMSIPFGTISAGILTFNQTGDYLIISSIGNALTCEVAHKANGDTFKYIGTTGTPYNVSIYKLS